MKKYSETFLNSHEILKHAVLGYEFEFYMKDLSFYKTLEILNQYLHPVKVHGFREYHPKFTPSNSEFAMTPDLSMGMNGVEIITGPMPYHESKFYLIKLLKFIQKYGYTNEKCSIHFNLSFSNESKINLNDLNILKLILNFNEDEIYQVYPSRKNNVYAKTIKKIIPYKEYDFNNIPIDIVQKNIRLPEDKYYGINFSHINKPKESQRLEHRYIGSKDYEKNIGQILYFLDKFILDVNSSIGTSFTDNDINNLEIYLDKNISLFKNFSKYDNFITEFPSVSIQIDQYNNYDVVNAYYDKIFPHLHNIIDSTENLKDCIINYVTSTQRVEIIDAVVKSTLNIKNYDFINCTISEGIFENCQFVNSAIDNSQIIKSRIDGTQLNNSKILNCHVESSQLNGCYFMNGYLNCDMDGGVFRSGKLGPYATLSSETKVVSDTDNFFNTKFDQQDGILKPINKGSIKSFKNKL